MRTLRTPLGRRLLASTMGIMLAAVGALVTAGAGGPAGAQVASTPGDKGSPLSPRLALLAEPTVAAESDVDQAAALSLPVVGPGSLARRDGAVLVQIHAEGALAEVGASLVKSSVEVVDVSEPYQLVTAAVPAPLLTAVAGIPGVTSVREVLAPSIGTSVRRRVAEPVTPGGVDAAATCRTGVVSEADTQLKAALARAAINGDGTGIRIGVLSDSYNRLGGAATDIAAAELPGAGNPCGDTTAVTVLAEGSSGNDEGRAMLQAIHDLVPGAQLAFATAMNGDTSFAANIRALRDWGADVIVDDAAYYNEPYFQDGPISAAVNDVTGTGVAYFSSAGNSNVVASGNAVGSYEAPAFRPTTCPSTLAAYGETACHDFDPTGGVDNGWNFTIAAGGSIGVDLQWAQPWYGVSTDLDVFLLDASTDAVVASSTAGVTVAPYEYFGGTVASAHDFKVVVGRYSATGTPRLKFALLGTRLISNVQYPVSSGGDVVGPTIFGHSGAANTGSTGAVPYNNSAAPETYSSHGPVTLYYGPVVSTSPAVALGAPAVLQKPDFAATDGARNSFFGQLVSGSWRFYGTSQAAPHAAAVAALLLQAAPDLTPAQVRSTLRSTAAAVAGGTTDSVGGGLVDALAAVSSLTPSISGLSPTSGPVGTSVTISGTNLTTTSAVRFNGTSASFSVVSATQVTATVPVGATTGTVSLTAVGGTATSSGSFTVTAPPPDRYTALPAPARLMDTRPGASTIDGAFAGQGALSAGQTRALTVTGRASVPGGTASVVLNVTVTGPAGAGYVTVYPCGTSRPLASNLNFDAGQTIPNAVIAKIGSGGQVCLYTSQATHLVVDAAGYFADTTAFTPLASPVRLLDTRPGGGGQNFSLQVAGRADVPVGASSAVLNVTVTGPVGAGYVTVYPCGQAPPLSSNLNYVPGQTIPNAVIAKIGAAGQVCLYSSQPTHLVVDVAGYFADATSFGPLPAPARLLDTRPGGSTSDGQFAGQGRLSPGQVVQLTVAGRAGIAADAPNVVLNVTVTGPVGPGYVTVYPCGQAPPLASNLNFDAGQTIPNAVIAKVGAGGAVCLYTSNATDLVADVAGSLR